ncbi:CoA-transferase family III [Methylobacterium sp. UNC378MF]|uniref:CoA transferase n=1 Tax=Methylobacterium sp. UNC378MF TaxID=1502748 RepID=UPI0008859631|nr:CoA transferase [Methylobacterium sp. UNC378MF]SDA09803.1 CoA-transferase family III [Methylobacterium sp. UNC378MF]
MLERHAAGDALPSILSEVLAALALRPDAGERLTVTGAENLPSCFPVTALATAAIGAAGVAVSELLGLFGHAPEVTVDRHLASAWFGTSLRPCGWTIPAAWDPIAGDYRTADGWIRLHTNAPHHRAAALAVLDCPGERDTVAAALAGKAAEPLEAAILRAGGCAAAMRSPEAWQRLDQGQAVRVEPLVSIAAMSGHGPSRWRPDSARPLAGIRVLDLTRILAGPVATRFLAGLGADVLRIDPPDWDEPSMAPDITLGKRCTRLDLHRAADRRQFETLLAEADILVHGYRPGALERLGYGEAGRRALNPNLIDVALCAYGWTGPWASRRGFDSLVQMATGIAAAGQRWKQADRPVPLPVQALDHATGYLMAAASLRGLIARLRDGQAVTAKLSLARTAGLLTDHAGGAPGSAFSGYQDRDFAPEIEHTAWGHALRLHGPLRIDGAPLRWDRPACALGSTEAAQVLHFAGASNRPGAVRHGR